MRFLSSAGGQSGLAKAYSQRVPETSAPLSSDDSWLVSVIRVCYARVRRDFSWESVAIFFFGNKYACGCFAFFFDEQWPMLPLCFSLQNFLVISRLRFEDSVTKAVAMPWSLAWCTQLEKSLVDLGGGPHEPNRWFILVKGAHLMHRQHPKG